MTVPQQYDREDTRLSALADQLTRAAQESTARVEVEPASSGAGSGGLALDARTLADAGAALRRHVQLRKSVRQKRHQAQLVAAIVAALFAVATGLLGQSSGWAGYNLGVAYGLLIGGALLAGVAGAFAVYLGIGEPEGLSG